MRDECARSARQLALLAEPCGGDAVAGALAPLVLVYGLGEQAQSPAFWRVYVEALGGLPRIALDRAVSEYPKTGKFFPKPAEILELAMIQANGLRTAAHRARKAADWTEPKTVPVDQRPSKEQMAGLMAEFREIMATKVPKAMTLKRRPPPCAKVDATGISEEMRAHMNRAA